jgi:hypothetical protein
MAPQGEVIELVTKLVIVAFMATLQEVPILCSSFGEGRGVSCSNTKNGLSAPGVRATASSVSCVYSGQPGRDHFVLISMLPDVDGD